MSIPSVFKLAIYLILIAICLFTNSCDEPEWKTSLSCCPTTNDEVICLVSDISEVPADGRSTILLTACIPVEADKTIRKITFEMPTEAGTFQSEGGANTIAKSLDPELRSASALLTVSRTPGDYRISAKVMDAASIAYSSEIILSLRPLDTSVIELSMTEPPGGLRGDHTRLVPLSVAVTQVDVIDQTATISISGPATFLSNPDVSTQDLLLNDVGEASFFLRMGNSGGLLVVIGEIDRFTTHQIWEILPAYPDQIQLVSDQQHIRSVNDSIHVEAYLYRNSGKVSNGVKVLFHAFQDINGAYLELGEVIPPILTSIYSEENASYGGVVFRTPVDSIVTPENPIFLIGETQNDTGQSIVDTLTIFVQE